MPLTRLCDSITRIPSSWHSSELSWDFQGGKHLNSVKEKVFEEMMLESNHLELAHTGIYLITVLKWSKSENSINDIFVSGVFEALCLVDISVWLLLPSKVKAILYIYNSDHCPQMALIGLEWMSKSGLIDKCI